VVDRLDPCFVESITGTVRQNRRGIPQTLKDYQLRNRGDIFVMNNGPLECYKYLDSKPVYMLSTKHDHVHD
jgi:hypothetical protein